MGYCMYGIPRVFNGGMLHQRETRHWDYHTLSKERQGSIHKKLILFRCGWSALKIEWGTWCSEVLRLTLKENIGVVAKVAF